MEPDSDIEVGLSPRKRYEVGHGLLVSRSLEKSLRLSQRIENDVASWSSQKDEAGKNIMGRPTQ